MADSMASVSNEVLSNAKLTRDEFNAVGYIY